MELSNEFEVPVPIDRAWSVLTDIERIAPCLPGAQLQEVDGEHYRGVVKVKVGPITAQYKGQATMVEKNDATHTALLQASGRDTRGAGNASANISAQLTDAGERTHVSLVTDLTITGKVAQFGRGVLADVSAKLLDQFVANLESTVLVADEPAGAASTASAASGAPESAAAVPPVPTVVPEVEPVDLLATAGAPVAKRVVSIAAIITSLALIIGLGRRRRRRRRAA
jgi:carbon monoxide dehydrogenase subunit G